MNRKGNSVLGVVILIVGLIIIFSTMMSCVGWNDAPYNTDNINSCIFSAVFFLRIIIGIIMATIGLIISRPK